jgi:hypothetical protein
LILRVSEETCGWRPDSADWVQQAMKIAMFDRIHGTMFSTNEGGVVLPSSEHMLGTTT